MIMPEDVGILINARRQFIVLETIYYNPEDIPFALDFSGMRLYMTRVPRLHPVGSLIVGDAFSSRAPGRVQSGFEYQHTCPYICTQNMSESEVELIGTYSQMHDAGQAVHTNIYDRDNHFKETVTQIDFWSAWLPGRIGAGTDGVTNELNRRHIKLHRGDQITITCTYNTIERRQTEFGSWAVDEVCVQFIHYFPVTVDVETGHEMNLCAFQALERGAVYGTSICADNGLFREFLYAPYRFKFAVNPLFNDYAGVPHPFATAALAANSCPSGKRKSSRGGHLAELDMGDASPQPDSGENWRGKKGKSKNKKGASKNKTDDLDDQLDDLDDNRHNDDDTDDSTVKGTPEAGLTSAFGSKGGGSCFPAGAMVTVKCTTSACSTTKKRMDEIEVGDQVQVGGKDRYSAVFMFSHQDGQHRGQFVRVHMGRRTMVMSHGHMVYVRGSGGDSKVVRAGDVRVGDELICVECREHDRDAGLVTKVEEDWDTGLFNPQTIDGDIVVNGVLATTFTDAVDMRAASALLSPIRALFRAIVMTVAMGRSSSMMEWHVAFSDWVCRAVSSMNSR